MQDELAGQIVYEAASGQANGDMVPSDSSVNARIKAIKGEGKKSKSKGSKKGKRPKKPSTTGTDPYHKENGSLFPQPKPIVF